MMLEKMLISEGEIRATCIEVSCNLRVDSLPSGFVEMSSCLRLISNTSACCVHFGVVKSWRSKPISERASSTTSNTVTVRQ